MLNKPIILSTLANDFLTAALPFEKGPDGKPVLKGLDYMEMSETDLLEKNPVGIGQASELLLKGIFAYSQQNGIEDDQALVVISREIAYSIKSWPKFEDYSVLAQFLENRRTLKKGSLFAAQAIHIAHNALGLDPIW